MKELYHVCSFSFLSNFGKRVNFFRYAANLTEKYRLSII